MKFEKLGRYIKVNYENTQTKLNPHSFKKTKKKLKNSHCGSKQNLKCLFSAIQTAF